MNRDNITQDELKELVALGYRVFTSNDPYWQTYCFYADGDRIGYMQRSSGELSLGSVHIPNKQTGTGFKIDVANLTFTRQCLDAAFVTAPSWASNSDRKSVVKYPTLEAFLNTKKNLQEVAA